MRRLVCGAGFGTGRAIGCCDDPPWLTSACDPKRHTLSRSRFRRADVWTQTWVHVRGPQRRAHIGGTPSRRLRHGIQPETGRAHFMGRPSFKPSAGSPRGHRTATRSIAGATAPSRLLYRLVQQQAAGCWPIFRSFFCSAPLPWAMACRLVSATAARWGRRWADDQGQRRKGADKIGYRAVFSDRH